MMAEEVRTMRVAEKVLMERDGEVLAKAYIRFNTWGVPASEDNSRFGQIREVDGVRVWGWHVAYIALDAEEFGDLPMFDGVGEFDYPDLPVYGGCTYYDRLGGHVPKEAEDVKTVFGDRRLIVVGWDYNHGYDLSWSDEEESEQDEEHIMDEVLKAWDEIAEERMRMKGEKGKEDGCELTMDMFFDKVGDLWMARSKDGEVALPILFCPFCGQRMSKE